MTTLQSLGRLGHNVYLLVSHWDIPGFYSRFCKGHFICPDESDEEAFLNFIIELLKNNRFDALIPASDAATILFSRHRERLLTYTRLKLPDQMTMEIASNKDKTYRFALEHGIPIPPTYFPCSEKEVRMISTYAIFPCFVKYPIGSASNAVFMMNTPDELTAFFAAREHDGIWPVIQQKVCSDLYGLTGVCEKGVILHHFTFRTGYQYSRGGTPPFAYSFSDERLLESAQSFLRSLNYSGPFDLDYLKNKNGEYLLLEINPRFSGTLNLAYKLGVDLPATYLQLIWGECPEKPLPTNYKTGVFHRSIFPDEIRWCFKNKKHLQFWLNFLKLGSKNNIYWDDLALLKWQIKESLWAVRHLKSEREKNKIA